MEFGLDPAQVELQQTVARFCADRFPLDAVGAREGTATDLGTGGDATDGGTGTAGGTTSGGASGTAGAGTGANDVERSRHGGYHLR